MVAARGNDALAHHLDEDSALALSRKIWGHASNYKSRTCAAFAGLTRACSPAENTRPVRHVDGLRVVIVPSLFRKVYGFGDQRVNDA